MKYLFFTNTPAHVHMYKNAIRELSQSGHDVKTLGRDYGCTVQLLDYFDLDYELYGRCETSKYSLLRELPIHYTNIIRKVRSFTPDLIFGIGAYAAHAGGVSRTPVVTIFDSEPTSVDHMISKPFTNALITPEAFEKNLGEKHYTFNGFKETAYIHPSIFDSAQNEIRNALQLELGEPYVIIRFNAFGSHHDVGRSGFDPGQKKELIDTLAEYAEVFVSDEGGELDFAEVAGRKFELHPAKMHDALAEAELLIADTQTMVTEAALLGTPAIRSNSFVGESDMGNFKDLEEHGLIHNEKDFSTVLERSSEILEDSGAKQRWEARRNEYLKDKVNLTQLIVDISNEFANSGKSVEDIVRQQEELA
jgi:predicted glycosyltransferase